ncbi:MAG: DUF2156 domain-containing protein [Nanoarchaeota archaeon]
MKKSQNERARVLDFLKKYGYNSSSYNILSNDKKYFFSEQEIEGVIAYVDITNTFLVAGDAVCSDSDVMKFVHEFRNFCRNMGKDCCFQATTKKFKEVLEIMGFGYIKIGEEPFFDLASWNLSGSAFMTLRNHISYAKRNGLSVIEYKPKERRNGKIEKQIALISEGWLKEKKTGEFSFLVGGPSFKEPGDRKYFLVVNKKKNIEAFLVCVPFFARHGMYFDIMRRKKKTIKGTTELLVTEAFQTLKEEGYSLVSLGSAPLSNVTSDKEKGQFIRQVLKFAYNNLNYFYHFKPLYHYKQKFGPTFWEPKYLAYYPPNFKPKYIFTVLKAYDPGGINDFLLSNIKSLWEKLKIPPIYITKKTQETISRKH